MKNTLQIEQEDIELIEYANGYLTIGIPNLMDISFSLKSLDFIMSQVSELIEAETEPHGTA